MLLDSDNDNDEEINSKGEAFAEEKQFKLTEQDNCNTFLFVRCSKIYLNEKRHQILLHMETLTFGS